jgi:Uma2 family endonuclease
MAAHPLLPPLREGDCLTSDEFMRLYEAAPDLKHVELIDGIVYMPSPVSNPHSNLHSMFVHWLATFQDASPGCKTGLQGTWLMDERSVPEPDATLRILPEFGGQSRIEGVYLAGAPELAVEVAVSSRARDLGVKLRLYERKGVREYLVAVAGEERCLWHVWTDGAYQLLAPDSDRILRSRCFPGLWLDPAALWRDDQKHLIAVLQQGLATPEHAAFVARLAG